MSSLHPRLRALCPGALALLVLLVTASAAFAQPAAAPGLPKGVEKGAFAEGITEYRLANGMKALLFPDQTKQTITVNVTVLVGSAHENYGETGMAHLLEHMAFKGTPTHPDIPKELNARGARFNASTWLDRTNYFEILPATDENLKWALEFEADRMVNSLVAKKDLDSEMTVVRNEFEAGENNPVGVLEERVVSTAYLWHNYGNSTIGSRADIENVPIERLQAFYKTYYQPDNAVLLVAGKFEPGKALQWANDSFGALPVPARKLPTIYTLDPTQDGERAVTLRRVGDTQVAMAAYHVPDGANPDFAAIQVLSYLLGNNPAGRLYKALVETKKAASVFTNAFQMRDPGLIYATAVVPNDGVLDGAKDAMLKTIEEFTKTPPAAEEVERAKTAILKQKELLLNQSDSVGLQMSEWISKGDWRLFFVDRDRIKAVKPDDVQRVAAAYLKPSNRTLGLFIPTPKPDRAEIPARTDIAAALKDYRGAAAVAEGEAFDPSPSNIEARTTRPAGAGGLTLALLPKKTRGSSVNATLSLHFGEEKSLMGRDTAAFAAGQMLMRGTATRTRQQISDEIDKLKARVMIFGSAEGATASIETTRENLPAVLRLVADLLKASTFPDAEFDQFRQSTIASLELARSEPQVQAQLALQQYLAPYPVGHPKRAMSPDETIAGLKALTAADVRKFHADFYGASRAEFAAVGDFDAPELGKLANELFGSWKSPKPFVRIPDAYKDLPALEKVFETPDKANAVVFGGMNVPIMQTDPDYPALLLGNWLLGGGTLKSRFADRIRGKDGLSYAVGSGLQAGAQDRSGRFFAFAICAPQNAEKVVAAFKEELAKALKDGFPEDELKAAKSGWTQGRQVSRAQDRGLAGSLANYLYLGRTFAWDADLEKKVDALTADQVVAVLRKYLDPAKVSFVRAGDFAKAAKAAEVKK